MGPDEDEDEDEITRVHAGELEPGVPQAVTGTVRLGPPSSSRPEGTVRLHGDRLGPLPREETVLLAPHAGPGEASRELAADDSGWGTVVLPGGGHPAYVVDRTQLIEVDAPDERRTAPPTLTPATTAVRTITVVPATTAVRTITVVPAIAAVPAISVTTPMVVPTAPLPMRNAAPAAWPIPPVGLAAPPTGGHPQVPASDQLLVSSGPHPLAASTPTGGVPIVPRPAPRRGGRAPGRPAAATGAHAGLRAVNDDSARLAWGFLLGVVITVAIVGVAVILALVLAR